MTDQRIVSGQVRMAVIGLGLMGKRHCQVIQAVPGAILAGVFDQSEAVASKVAIENLTKPFSSYDELLASPEVDAVVICLPSSLHARFGIQAAQAGKHVVVEKPIDSQAAEGERLIAACEQAGVQCCVISQNRYSPGVAALKAAVESGLMGKPVLARATVKWFRHDEYYTESTWRGRRSGEHGGVLINQAVHSIDTLQWLFGLPADVIGYSHCAREHVMETEDTAVTIFRWKQGLLATLEACTSAAPGFDEAYEVHSPVASIKVEKGKIVYWHHNDCAPEPVATLRNNAPALDTKLSMFYRQYLNIVDAITGTAPLDVSAREALSVVETIERIYATKKC